MTTKPSVLTNLINQSPVMLLCSYGNGAALGFRGSPEARRLAENLFHNYDEVEHDPIYLHEQLSYMYTSLARIKKSLCLFFRVNLLHAREATESTVEKLAAECADLFIATFRVGAFMPARTNALFIEHELGELAAAA